MDRCRRCGAAAATEETSRARLSRSCLACDAHPDDPRTARPSMVEHRQAAGGHVYLIAGDGGWWIVKLPEHDEMLAVDGRAEGERYGAGRYEEARARARDVVDSMVEADS